MGQIAFFQSHAAYARRRPEEGARQLRFYALPTPTAVEVAEVASRDVSPDLALGLGFSWRL